MSSIKNLLKGNPFNNILWGIVLHTVGQFLRTITDIEWFIIVLGTIGWYYIIKGIIYTRRWKNPFKGLYRVLFALYLIIVSVMIIRGYFIDYQYIWFTKVGAINYHLFLPSYILCYFVPLLVFIPKDYYSLRIPVKCASYFGVLSLFIFVIFFQQINQASRMGLQGEVIESGIGNTSVLIIYASFTFIALCSKYIDSKEWRYNFIGVLISLLVTLIGGRRGNSATIFAIFLCMMYFYIQSKNKSWRFFYYIMLLVLLGSMVAFFFNSSLFAYIHQRGLEDSRSAVDEALLSQMSNWELWFGKGLNGRYYLPLTADDYLNGWRYGSETGFYNYVLKGGYIMIGLYIYLLIVPIYKGFFKSRNLLCKMGAMYIFLSLLELYPFGLFMFNMKFCIIWMMVAICMSQKWLNMDDNEIKIRLFK